MGSPFGLAYGLGAGLAAGPFQAYYKGQDDAMARGLKELEAAEYRRKVAEQQSLNEALSQPVAAQQPTTITTPGVTQEQYDEMVSHDVPEGEEGPSQAYGQQVSKKIQVTPFETEAGKRAAMLQNAAEMQRSRGFGLSSQQLMTQAGQAEKEHQSASALELIRASKFGDTGRMMSAIHALGGVNVQSVRPSENGGVVVTAGDGGEVELDESDLRSIATGSDPVDIFRQKAVITQKNKIEQDQLKAAQRMQELQVRLQGNMDLLKQRFANQKEMAPIMAQLRAQYGDRGSTAKMKDIENYARIYMQSQAQNGNDVTPEQAQEYAMNLVIGTNRGQVTPQDQYRAASRNLSQLLKDNKNASNPKDEDYPTYKALTDQINELIAGGARARNPQGSPHQATPQGGGRFHVRVRGGRVVESNDPNQRVNEIPRGKDGKVVQDGDFNYN